MKKILVCCACAGAFSVSLFSSRADPVFADNFNSYTAGALVGQGPWLQTSTIATTPIQATGTAATVGSSGQDVYAALNSSIPVLGATSGSFFLGATITVNSAQAGGDYFLHLESSLGSTSGFFDKIFAKSTTGGFLLGASENLSAGNYGTTVLTLGTSYRIVLEEDSVPLDKNDTFKLYINPTDLSVAGNNTAYETFTWSATASSEPASIVGVNLRQGSSSSAPNVTVDDIDVSTVFSDASQFTPVVAPEPSTMAMLGLGGMVAGLFAFRRRNA